MKSKNCISTVGMLVLAVSAAISFGRRGSSLTLPISISGYRLSTVLQILINRLLLADAMVLLTSTAGFAQVTIQNDKHRDLPKQKVDLLFRTACQVAAERFHVPPSGTQFQLTLVMGEVNERISATNRRLRIYKLTAAGSKHLEREVSRFERMLDGVTRVLARGES